MPKRQSQIDKADHIRRLHIMRDTHFKSLIALINLWHKAESYMIFERVENPNNIWAMYYAVCTHFGLNSAGFYGYFPDIARDIVHIYNGCKPIYESDFMLYINQLNGIYAVGEVVAHAISAENG